VPAFLSFPSLSEHTNVPQCDRGGSRTRFGFSLVVQAVAAVTTRANTSCNTTTRSYVMILSPRIVSRDVVVIAGRRNAPGRSLYGEPRREANNLVAPDDTRAERIARLVNVQLSGHESIKALQARRFSVRGGTRGVDDSSRFRNAYRSAAITIYRRDSD